MERSAFNIVVPRDSGAVIYNTAKGSLETLDEASYKTYLACEGEDKNEGEHDTANWSAVNHLCELGFFVSSREEEIEWQHQLFEAAKHNTSELALCIAPTYACNCACSYCSEDYEKDLCVMSEEIQNDILAFVKAIYERDTFKQLYIQWYGGEPMLAFNVIENLSEKLITFCDENHIQYRADIITNATLVTPEKAKRLCELKVVRAMPTLDGTRDRHNARRPLKNGEDSYKATRAGIDALNNAGIFVDLMMNCDRNNIADFDKLQRELAQDGVSYTATMLKNYNGKYECTLRFAKPEFDLMPRDEFCELQQNFMKRSFANTKNTTSVKQRVLEMLRPAKNFCHGQLMNYFAIDAIGDVYKCDGWMGKREYALFNLTEPYDVNKLDSAVAAYGGIKHPCRDVDARATPNYNPYNDEECKGCAVLPLCQGECAWDRELIGDSCHVLKDTATFLLSQITENPEEPITKSA